MELQTFFGHVAFRLPVPIKTGKGQRTQIIISAGDEKMVVLDTTVPLIFDSLTLLDTASFEIGT